MPFSIDIERIRAVESAVGRKLPDSYVAFMEKSNGGNTPDDRWILHPIFDNSDKKHLQRTANHLLRETEKARQIPAFPQGAIVIGENMETSLLLLVPNRQEIDRFDFAVFSWHPYHRQLDKVVDDFSEFRENPYA